MFRYGVPFLVLVVGAPFVLKDLFGARFEYRRVTAVSREQEEHIKELGLKKKEKEEVSPEKLHEEYMKRDYQVRTKDQI